MNETDKPRRGAGSRLPSSFDALQVAIHVPYKLLFRRRVGCSFLFSFDWSLCILFAKPGKSRVLGFCDSTQLCRVWVPVPRKRPFPLSRCTFYTPRIPSLIACFLIRLLYFIEFSGFCQIQCESGKEVALPTVGPKPLTASSRSKRENGSVRGETNLALKEALSNELHKVLHRLSGGPAYFGTIVARKKFERSKNRAGSSSKRRNGHAGDPQGS